MISNYMKSLIQGESALYETVYDKASTRGTVNITSLWGINPYITISFFEGFPMWAESEMRRVIEDTANYATYRYEFFAADDHTADVRITAREGIGTWSYVGIDCKRVRTPDPTMNFGWLDDGEDLKEFLRVAYHEWYHCLGLVHEHENPLRNQFFTLDYDLIASDLSISVEQAELIYGIKYDTHSSIMGYRPDSLMHYPIQKLWNQQGIEIKMPYVPTAQDLMTLQRVLPAVYVGS